MPSPKTDFSADIKELKDAISEINKAWPKEYADFSKAWQQVQVISDNGSLQDIVKVIEEHADAITAFEDETTALKDEVKKKTKEFNKLKKDGKDFSKLEEELMSKNMDIDKKRPKELKALNADMAKFKKRFSEITKQLDTLKKSVIKQEKQQVYLQGLMNYCDAKQTELAKEIKAVRSKADSAPLKAQAGEIDGLKGTVRKINQQLPETLELANAIQTSKKTPLPPEVAKKMKALGLK